MRATTLNGRTVTFVHDGFLSRVDGHGDPEGLLMEAPTAASSSVPALLASARVDRSAMQLEVKTSLLFGRFLYYCTTRAGEFFCATHLSLLRAAGQPLVPDEDALPEFLLFRHIAPPRTLISGVRALPAGSSLALRIADDPAPSVRLPAAFDALSEHRDPADYRTRVRELLEETVGALGAGTDPAFLLSGGLDSSILFASGRRLLGVEESYATSYPFENRETNREKHYATSAAAAFQSNHHHYVPTLEEYRYGLIDAIAASEQPVHHLQSVLLHLLFHHGLPKESRIVVSGEGADTIFGNRFHRWLHWATTHRRLRAALTSPLVHTPLRMMTRALGRGTGTLATLGEMWRADLAIEDPRHLIWDVSRYGWEDWICRHCNVTPARIIEGRLGIAGVTAGLSILDRAALMTMLADVGATESIWGSLCESAGKLLYYPYGRDALVAYALSISWAERLAEPKRILRQVAEDLGVPRFIITRKKSGFSINPARWAPRGTVFDPFIPLVGSVFPKDELLRLQSPEMQRAMTYWNLINYGLWKRLVVDGHPASRLKDEVREEVQRLEHRQGAGKPTSPR